MNKCVVCKKEFNSKKQLKRHVHKWPTHKTQLDRAAASPEQLPFLYDYSALQANRLMFMRSDERYFASAANGFARLFTCQCQAYWLSAAELEHRAPDWKLHFSVAMKDVARAFNLLAELFMALDCNWGMKACCSVYDTDSSWPAHMRGREITVYMYQSYRVDNQRLIPIYETDSSSLTSVRAADLHLPECNPEAPPKCFGAKENNNVEQAFNYRANMLPDTESVEVRFWAQFVAKAERLLKQHRIVSNGGCADGDFPLTACRYASVRNESFALLTTNEWIYPRNEMGYNAARQTPDIAILMQEELKRCQSKQNHSSLLT